MNGACPVVIGELGRVWGFEFSSFPNATLKEATGLKAELLMNQRLRVTPLVSFSDMLAIILVVLCNHVYGIVDDDKGIPWATLTLSSPSGAFCTTYSGVEIALNFSLFHFDASVRHKGKIGRAYNVPFEVVHLRPGLRGLLVKEDKYKGALRTAIINANAGFLDLLFTEDWCEPIHYIPLASESEVHIRTNSPGVPGTTGTGAHLAKSACH
ncbi:hypothetical protein FOZ61_000886 [Perkinsus olseni]|uniref:Uncharacterized protein n=1 Tax=Perkinsus olseni TaxID=32597 RepID=A0A7J6LZG6_PEROL|nr:hypothetical protein FOZ61_000886 [Perkinsus olseni]